jgi:hypothetical protein
VRTRRTVGLVGLQNLKPVANPSWIKRRGTGRGNKVELGAAAQLGKPYRVRMLPSAFRGRFYADVGTHRNRICMID